MVNKNTLELGPSSIADRTGWLKWRGRTLGASEASSILGCNPWSTPLQLYAKKMGVMADKASDSEAAKWGHRLQQPILDGWSDETGLPCRTWEIGVVNPQYPWLHATPDAVVGDEIPVVTDSMPDTVQAKATSMERAWENGVPPMVFAQVQQEMLVTNSKTSHVAVLFNGKRFSAFEVPFDEVWCESTLIPKTQAFYDGLEAGVPPKDITADDADALKALWPSSVDVTEPIALPGFLLDNDDNLQQLKAQIKELEGQKRTLENEFKAALEEHSEGVLPNGVRYSWKSATREYKAKEAYSVNTRILRRHKS